MASKNSCACHGVVVTLASCLLLVAAAVSVSVLAAHVAVGRVWSPAGAAAAAGHHHSLSPAWVPSPSSRHAHHARELVNRRVQVGRMEAGLVQARVSIRRASRTRSCTPDDGGGFIPRGAVYRDAYAFHQSYIEMEKRFKVWTYREGEPPVVQKGGAAFAGNDGIEGHLIAELDSSGGGGRHRARHPGEAHAFFLPISVASIAGYVYRRDMIDFWDPQLRLVAGYVDGLAAMYPFWNRSRGADHFLAPILSAAKAELRGNAIRVMCDADMSDGFDPATDVALPPVVASARATPPQGRVASERTVLAFFAAGGGGGGAVREALLARWEGRDDRVVVYGRLPAGVDHGELMRRARFCLCPCGGGEGAAAASRRVVEAITAGCVPVLVDDGGYSPPFSDVLDWARFSVAVPAERVGEIKDILGGVSDRRYGVLRRRVLRVRRHFRLNRPPAKRFDVVNMVIHSIWLRRLNLSLPY
uniref:Exostosin GT47 domain-containing protein n=1 Tax=Oryza rufipogon TaxID=4529 RepID=A0A0E0Q1P4_ORYRU